MAKKYDVVVAMGTYVDKESGEEKTRWLDIGAVFTTENGFALKINAIPTDWDGWAHLAPSDGGGQQETGKRQQGGSRGSGRRSGGRSGGKGSGL